MGDVTSLHSSYGSIGGSTYIQPANITVKKATKNTKGGHPVFQHSDAHECIPGTGISISGVEDLFYKSINFGDLTTKYRA